VRQTHEGESREYSLWVDAFTRFIDGPEFKRSFSDSEHPSAGSRYKRDGKHATSAVPQHSAFVWWINRQKINIQRGQPGVHGISYTPFVP
jgi:hypothetical protein